MQSEKWDINRPWLTLDDWQKEYIFDENTNQDNFLISGRQNGKTTAMALRAVELCLKHFKKGEFILVNSITEKQAYHILTKCLIYAKEKYYNSVKWKGKDKPTMHKLLFTNGTGILCYAAGETGEGQRGFTIKKLMIDEGSRMNEEYFVASMPMLSVIGGSMDIASTPAGKHHKDGSEKFFYKCSKNTKFKKYYISAEDCPRHSKEFLAEQKERLTELAYAQEYLATFTDALKEFFTKELIDKMCSIKKMDIVVSKQTLKFLGVDVAGFGKDDCTFESFQKLENGKIYQFGHLVEKRNYTTDTTKRIIELDLKHDYKQIGVDDGGIGFGVYSELMNDERTKRKTIALNNASRATEYDENRKKRLLKEEMYINLKSLAENGQIFLIDDDEIRASLQSMQWDDGCIIGYNSHIAEGIVRAIWLANQKHLNIFIRRF